MFAFRETRGVVEVAFTDRHPGEGGGPDASLNLAEPKTDQPFEASPSRDRVEHEIALAAGAFVADRPDQEPTGAGPVPPVVRMRQVHGADVWTVTRDWLERRGSEPPACDGLVTDEPGVILLVRVADCVPVLLADVEHRVVGTAHAGRVGLAAGIVPATVGRMRALGAERLVAWVGPRVCGGCYEVPAEMREDVAAVVPESYAETSWGTPALDVGAGVVAQLTADGVEVVDVPRCTVEDEDLYSYRRQGAEAGRFGGLVWVRP